MPLIKEKTIILGITGSIAAYKAGDITSALTKLGASVYPVLTPEAAQFTTPLMFKTLARKPVSVDLWEEGKGWQPGHIELADKADLLLVAPATANSIAHFSHGLAPDLLSSIYLATPAPVMIAPAMNGKMLEHPATQANLTILENRGHTLIHPDKGTLACGYEGYGKLATVDKILTAVLEHFGFDSAELEKI